MGQSSRRLLFIEPDEPPTFLAVFDSLTRKVCAAFRLARASDYAYGGIHCCRCGAYSTNIDHILPNGMVTNSLCVHYVAHHRSAVSAHELELIDAFEWGEAEPVEAELQGPQTIEKHARERTMNSLGWITWWRKCGLDLDALSRNLHGYEKSVRENAEDLFELLTSIKTLSTKLFSTLKCAGINRGEWGSRAFRLPIWDRQAWVDPMIALLTAGGLSPSERRYIAMQFRHFRELPVEFRSVLVSLQDTADVEQKSAIELALRRLDDD